ncbi:MAG: hypothetical protein U9R15_12085, partial [Chloroflexota bacterium]|nr:hypothetical protein [Chloroflexota bacterium]
MATEITKLKQISGDSGISLLAIKAIIGISKPARAALRLHLTRIKRSLQAELSTYAFKHKIAERKQIEILKTFSSAGASFSQVKRILNTLNFSSEHSNAPEIQQLIDIILSNAKVKGVTLKGYRDSENIMNALNFKAHQAVKLLNFAEGVARTVNKKIDAIDNYIKVLDAVN